MSDVTGVKFGRLDPERIAARVHLVDPTFRHTPLHETAALNDWLNCRVSIKVETLNPIGCFKGRGASTLLAAHVERFGTSMTIVGASAGNWGQALAFCGRRIGVAVTVFAAENANSFKVDRMRSLGAEVVLVGTDFDEAKSAARKHAEVTGGRFVEDGEDLAVTEGHGSIAIEIIDRLRADGDTLDVIYVPIGNGALASGVGAMIKHLSPATAVIGVCPSGAPAMKQAWSMPNDRSQWSTPDTDTIADGLAIREPTPLAVADLRNVVDDIVLVSDDDIITAERALLRHARVVVEPSGAAGIAAALVARDQIENKHVATIACGANVSPAHWPVLVA